MKKWRLELTEDTISVTNELSSSIDVRLDADGHFVMHIESEDKLTIEKTKYGYIVKNKKKEE